MSPLERFLLFLAERLTPAVRRAWLSFARTVCRDLFVATFVTAVVFSILDAEARGFVSNRIDIAWLIGAVIAAGMAWSLMPPTNHIPEPSVNQTPAQRFRPLLSAGLLGLVAFVAVLLRAQKAGGYGVALGFFAFLTTVALTLLVTPESPPPPRTPTERPRPLGSR